MTQSGELRACPCGAVPNHGYYGDIADECGYGYVECHENGLSIVVHAETEADAISAWNASRPSIRDEALEEAAKAVEALDMQFHDTFLDGRDEAVRAIRALKSGG